MNKEIKEQAHRKFKNYLEMCYMKTLSEQQNKILFEFLDSLIDKTVQMEQERIGGVIKEHRRLLVFTSKQTALQEEKLQTIYESHKNCVDEIISLITNKSDFNKDKK